MSAVAQAPILNLEGMLAATIEARLAYGSGGASVKAFNTTTLLWHSTYVADLIE